MACVIRVENLSKQYRLGVISAGTLRDDLQRWWYRVRRLPDPLSRIDSSSPVTGPENQILWALQGVSFQVEQGEVLGIIGRNGAGKSTLLKILSRVTAPTSGTIKVKGRIASLLEVGTGFHPELTGRENVFLNGAILGMTRHEVRAKLDEIISFAEVERFIDTPVKRYSSGMYVRLAFSVAAHLDPEILVVDEVLAVGDLSYQNKCIEKMSQLASEKGKTILFVSHNLKIIENLCSRVVVLKTGRLMTSGPVQQCLGDYYQSESRSPLVRAQATNLLVYQGTRVGDGRGTIHMDDNLLLSVTLSVGADDLKDFELDVAVLNQREEYVLHMRSSYLTPTILLEGHRRVTVKFDMQQPRLAPGTYHVTVFASVHNRPLCWIEYACVFTVSAVTGFGVTKDFPLLRAPYVPATSMSIETEKG